MLAFSIHLYVLKKLGYLCKLQFIGSCVFFCEMGGGGEQVSLMHHMQHSVGFWCQAPSISAVLTCTKESEKDHNMFCCCSNYNYVFFLFFKMYVLIKYFQSIHFVVFTSHSASDFDELKNASKVHGKKISIWNLFPPIWMSGVNFEIIEWQFGQSF